MINGLELAQQKQLKDHWTKIQVDLAQALALSYWICDLEQVLNLLVLVSFSVKMGIATCKSQSSRKDHLRS